VSYSHATSISVECCLDTDNNLDKDLKESFSPVSAKELPLCDYPRKQDLCPPSFRQLTCKPATNSCGGAVCQQGDTFHEDPEYPVCIYLAGYARKFCETGHKEWVFSSYHNGAVCQDRINGCSCLPGYQGRHCELEVDGFVSHHCRSEGDVSKI
jgi:protein crumbs